MNVITTLSQSEGLYTHRVKGVVREDIEVGSLLSIAARTNNGDIACLEPELPERIEHRSCKESVRSDQQKIIYHRGKPQNGESGEDMHSLPKRN